ncbi:hypothetical protein HHK36_029234 [Tetracentron sinense]|uniref:Homeobox-leucine zipper protein n=1 Tax=Tetracentron sinense TaxID=13715 RepID=A0A834YIU2_TETSI|nr:hypothetical protein HHK36_029234 [Tetracentron sinense]
MLESPAAAKSESESLTFLDSLQVTSKRKSKNSKKRRFSHEQIKSMESMFESESKLETRQKLHLATELGLHPRQVAIWFQNRRARWKSKNLERDYSILRANYDTLASQFESLKKEQQSLLIQLQKLRDLLEKPPRVSLNSEVKPNISWEESDHKMVVYSDDYKTKRAECFEKEEEPDFLNMAEPTDESLTSPENWCNFDSGGLFDESCNSLQWWNIWS